MSRERIQPNSCQTMAPYAGRIVQVMDAEQREEHAERPITDAGQRRACAMS